MDAKLKVGDIVIIYNDSRYNYKIILIDEYNNIRKIQCVKCPNKLNEFEPIYDGFYSPNECQLVKRKSTKDPRPSWF